MPSFRKVKYSLLAPFSKRFQKKLRRQEYRELPKLMKDALQACVSSDDRKLVCIKNSKAGCTTLVQVIHKYSKGSFHQSAVHIEADNFRQGDEHWKENLALIHDPNSLNFSFLREPKSRFVSAYRNFFIDQTNKHCHAHIEAMRRRGMSDDNSLEYNIDLFLDYLSECQHPAEDYCDRHFRQQKLNICQQYINYGFLGRMENMTEDLKALFKKVDAPEDFIEQLTEETRFNVSVSGQPIALSQSQNARVEALYADDFELYESNLVNSW